MQAQALAASKKQDDEVVLRHNKINQKKQQVRISNTLICYLFRIDAI